jgi:5-methylcytosine-specific restriction endonuclease McrA
MRKLYVPKLKWGNKKTSAKKSFGKTGRLEQIFDPSFYRSTEWKKLRAACLYRDDYTCTKCNKRPEGKSGLHVDHIVSRSKGGRDTLGNLQVLCVSCHKRKTNIGRPNWLKVNWVDNKKRTTNFRKHRNRI